MNRRNAIRSLVIISAGSALLPACSQADKSSLVLNNLAVTGSQEKLIAALSNAIIPSSSTFIGAADLGSHEFVLIMVDDCNSTEDQKTFTNGMKLFDENCRKKYSQPFVKCTEAQKSELLKQAELNSKNDGDENKFYNMVRRYTIQSFTSSEKYLTEIKHYKIIPGSRFKGCVPV